VIHRGGFTFASRPVLYSPLFFFESSLFGIVANRKARQDRHTCDRGLNLGSFFEIVRGVFYLNLIYLMGGR
jgi:hypothetical protein